MIDLTLTPEQEMLRKTLREFVDREIRPLARDWDTEGRYPTEIIERMKEMGLFGMTVPPDHGGMGIDMVSMALVFEEISRGWMGIAGVLGTHSLACWMLARYGTQEQKERYLPVLATGKRRSGLALTEPGGGSDLQGMSTRAWREGDEYVIRGTKIWITNARHADPLPVLVKTDPTADPPHRGMSVLLVEAGIHGFNVSKDMGKLGYKGTESCEVQFDDCRVPVGSLLGAEEGHGLQQALSALELGRINIAARSVGIAQEAYAQALEYARTRHAFGNPIGEFQAIQLKLADMATKVQAARLLTWWAASQADRGERSDLEAAMAKLFASEVALQCSLESMRVHGGAGYSTEFEVERLYRDAPLMAIGEGTNEILQTVIARGLVSGRWRLQ